VAADGGDAAILHRAGVEGTELADDVVVADFQAVGSPAYFLSCGASPSETKWEIVLRAPIRVWPVMTAWAPTVVPAPISTCSPMIV